MSPVAHCDSAGGVARSPSRRARVLRATSGVAVLSRAARHRGAARDNPSAAANFVAVADIAPAAACADAATGPADLGSAARLTSPAAYRALPAWAMAAVGPPSPWTLGSTTTFCGSCGGTAFASPRRARLATTLMAMARRGSRASGRCHPGRLGRVGGPSGDRSRMDTELWQLRRPPRLPAQACDPVDRLRRLPEPRLAAHMDRYLPGSHLRVVGLWLLRLERARELVRVGHGVSRPCRRIGMKTDRRCGHSSGRRGSRAPGALAPRAAMVAGAPLGNRR